MRLENTDDAVKIHLAGGLKRCHHLGRMVCIVVNDGGTVCHVTGQLETTRGTRELLEACRRFFCVQTEEEAYAAGSQCVEHVVAARNGQIDMGEEFALVHDVKAVIAVTVGDVFRIDVCFRRCAEGNAGAVNALHSLHRVGRIVVDNNRAVFRNQLTETMERMNDVVDVLEEVQMIGIDIQNDSNRRMEAEEGIGVLAGLCDEVIMCADAQGAADGVQIAADHDGRVRAALHADHRQHRSRCRLAVGAGYTDSMLVFQHDFAPSLCALHDRNVQLTSVCDFRIVIVYRSGTDHKVCAVYVFRQMGVCNVCAELGQLVRDSGFGAVRAGYLGTEMQQQLSERRYGHAANTDEVNGLMVFYIGL